MAKSIKNSKNVVADSTITAETVHVGDKINQFLSPTTPNFTQDWFTNHINTAVANLHDRYSPKEHFDLPAAQMFSGLARDVAFQAYAKECFHLFLKTVQEKTNSLRNSAVDKAFLELVERLRTDIRAFYDKIQWSAGVPLDLSSCIDLVECLHEETEKTRAEFREKRHQELENRHEQKQEYHTEPFSSELYGLRELRNTAVDFLEILDGNVFKLAAKPTLLLTGKAGNGKSHLLGDSASKKATENQPVVLILGNQLKMGTDFWLQMLGTIGLHCNGEVFLTELNEAGKKAGVRALLMIDALNEGDGKEIWKHHIAGFVEQISRYPYIGLVLAVRSTYLDAIVPKTLLESKAIVRFEHQGFSGYELEAVKHFCHLFELVQPRFPILSPEFTNPQLLLLLCKTLKKKGQKTLPEGMSGITAIYESYLEAVNERMADKLGYPEQKNWVRKGLEKLGDALTNGGEQHLETEKAIQIFRELSPEFGAKLFDELTFRESILTEDSRLLNYKTKERVEVIGFGYERLRDYLIARRLLSQQVQKDDVTAAFQKEGFFKGFFAPERLYRNKGVLEAIAVLLPELYGMEIVEVFPELSLKSDNNQLGYFVVESWIAGLFWRKKETIDQQKITDLFRKWVRHSGTANDLQNMRLSLAVIPNHPLNADWLHASLERLSMPVRDSVWSSFLNETMSNDESGIKRTIDWIWREEELEKLPDEVVRLAAILLGWCFTSSNRHLRDLATLTAVRLLDERPDILVKWMQKFELVDDMYVQERVFAVALGVTLRMENQQGIVKIAQYVYERVFSQGEPPVHILLRDYARTTVEYAFHLQLPVNLDAQKIRPPYSSTFPNCPSESDVKKYEVQYDSEEFAKDKIGFSAQSSIEHSVLTWDFNRYVIKSKVSYFATVSFTKKQEINAFIKGLNKELRQLMKLYEGVFELVVMHKEKKVRSEFLKYEDTFRERLQTTNEQIISLLNEEQRCFFIETICPFLSQKFFSKYRNGLKFDHEPIARWILQRVFELGWSRELHGNFDYNVREYGHQQEEGLKAERIGKKYQWIAFHEIMARIADNYYLYEYSEKPRLFEGTFSPFLRTMDPTYPYINREYHPIKQPVATSSWFIPVAPDNWHDPNWINLKEGLPDPINLTQFTDEKGQSWLAIINFPEWKSEEDFGEKDYRSKRIWYQIRAYFIHQKDENKAMKWFSKQNFMRKWMLEHKGHYELFEREMFWSNAQRHFDARARSDGFKAWRKTHKSATFNVMVPIEEYESGGGSFELQGGHFFKPSAYLWEKMDLKYGKKTGQVFDKHGGLAFQDFSTISDKQHIFLVNKDILLEFLREHKLSITWTILGEKQLFGNIDNYRDFIIKEINGVMLLNPTGEISVVNFQCDDRKD
jgi:hypothetical protein